MSIIWSGRHKNTMKFMHTWMEIIFFSLTNFHNVSLTLVKIFSKDIYSLQAIQSDVYWFGWYCMKKKPKEQAPPPKKTNKQMPQHMFSVLKGTLLLHSQFPFSVPSSVFLIFFSDALTTVVFNVGILQPFLDSSLLSLSFPTFPFWHHCSSVCLETFYCPQFTPCICMNKVSPSFQAMIHTSYLSFLLSNYRRNECSVEKQPTHLRSMWRSCPEHKRQCHAPLSARCIAEILFLKSLKETHKLNICRAKCRVSKIFSSNRSGQNISQLNEVKKWKPICLNIGREPQNNHRDSVPFLIKQKHLRRNAVHIHAIPVACLAFW